MGKEYVAKSFKSGNSVAIRIPAALGVEPDREWTVIEQDGELRIRARPAGKCKLDVDRFWGKAKHLQVPQRTEFDERPSAPKRQAKGAA